MASEPDDDPRRSTVPSRLRPRRPPGEQGGHTVQDGEQPPDGSFIPPGVDPPHPALDEKVLPDVVPLYLKGQARKAGMPVERPMPAGPAVAKGTAFPASRLEDILVAKLTTMLARDIRECVAAALDEMTPPSPPQA